MFFSQLNVESDQWTLGFHCKRRLELCKQGIKILLRQAWVGVGSKWMDLILGKI
jgi:hypothetical protein